MELSGNLEILAGIGLPNEVHQSKPDGTDLDFALQASSGYIPHVAEPIPSATPDMNTQPNLDFDYGFGLLDVPLNLDIGAPVDVDMPRVYDESMFTADAAQKWANFHPEFQCVITDSEPPLFLT